MPSVIHIHDEDSQRAAVQDDYVKKHIVVPFPARTGEAGNAILRELHIPWAGYYEASFGHVLQPRVLEDEYCMLYCIDGFAHVSMDGVTYVAKPGDVLFLLKGVVHACRADEKAPWSTYWIGFAGAHAEYYLKLLKVSLQNPIIHVGIDDALIRHFVETINVLSNGCICHNLLHATACLRYLLSRMIDIRFDPKLTLASTVTTNSIIEIMRTNINRMLSLDEVSRLAGISKYHLTREMKKSEGYPPLKYFMRLKMQRACELLRISGTKVKDVSETLGFGTPYHFSHVFKQHMGVAPNDYRKSQSVPFNPDE